MHWIIVLLIAALGFTVAEVMFPSFGMLGLVAATSYVAAVILAFDEGPTLGWTVLIVVLLLAPTSVFLGFRALPHTPIGRRLMLRAPRRDEISAAPDADLVGLIGRTGVAVSPLRPSGLAEFDGRRVHVVAGIGFVDSGERVRVREVEGSRVVVDALPENAPDSGPPIPHP